MERFLDYARYFEFGLNLCIGLGFFCLFRFSWTKEASSFGLVLARDFLCITIRLQEHLLLL